MPELDEVLRVEAVEKRFGNREVLRSASLWARRGRVTALLGRNGSGKTTLLRVAAGDLRPDNGFIRFRGRLRTRHSLPLAAREGLMFSPQETLLCPGLSLRQHLEALAAAFGLSGWEEAVTCARLESLLDRKVARLSTGERKRAELGLALARRPRLLLADEPLSSLSPHDRELVAGGLRLLADRGAAVVVSGHDLDALLALADEVLWSVAGTTHHLGGPKDALQNEAFRAGYLGWGPSGASDRG